MLDLDIVVSTTRLIPVIDTAIMREYGLNFERAIPTSKREFSRLLATTGGPPLMV
jgi:hypothetical protein